MNYVLVSLTANGDGATEDSDEFARWFISSHPPARSFHGEPSHDEVLEAVQGCGRAIVFGHDGGGSLRAASKGAPWADPTQFAQTFRGATVWVYACRTREVQLEDDLVSFGRLAREGGVGVFAGHCTNISSIPSLKSMPALRDAVYRAYARAFRAFVRGENRADELQRAALAQMGKAGTLAVFGARQVEVAMRSLRVL